MAMTPNNRTTFVNAVKALVLDNEVDGIEIEYVPQPFLRRVSDPLMIVVGSFRVSKRLEVVTRFLPMIPQIIFSSSKT